MARWRAKALELLPEFSAVIESSDNPYGLWIELRYELERAHEGRQNEPLVQRFYMYADWCWRQRPQKELDLNNCVAVCFYEHLPEHPATRDDMPRWISREKFNALAPLFERCLGKDGFDELKRYHESNAAMYESNFSTTLRGRRRKASSRKSVSE